MRAKAERCALHSHHPHRFRDYSELFVLVGCGVHQCFLFVSDILVSLCGKPEILDLNIPKQTIPRFGVISSLPSHIEAGRKRADRKEKCPGGFSKMRPSQH